MKSVHLDDVRQCIVSCLDMDASQVTERTHFANDLNADSLDALSLIECMNQRFNTEVSPERVQQVDTVQDMIDLMNAALSSS